MVQEDNVPQWQNQVMIESLSTPSTSGKDTGISLHDRLSLLETNKAADSQKVSNLFGR